MKKRKKAPATRSSAKQKAAKIAVKKIRSAASVATSTKKKTDRQLSVRKTEARPPRMRKPKKPDDLKLISGVGPKLEKTLNGLGIYKFEQIAKWKKPEREWVDGHLNFKGRIDREDWKAQAKVLAKNVADN